jgi:hypothetical protein
METEWINIVEELKGSCETLSNVLENHNRQDLDNDMNFLEYLDNNIFNCSGCGWWYEISECSNHHHESYCDGCYEDLENEED